MNAMSWWSSLVGIGDTLTSIRIKFLEIHLVSRRQLSVSKLQIPDAVKVSIELGK